MPKKVKLQETTIFPLSCERGHNYTPLRDNEEKVRGFYKDNDRSTVYTTLFCTRCGETKEIIMVKYAR